MKLKDDLLALAKDYRGDLPYATNPNCPSDTVVPQVFRDFASPIGLLALRLINANATSFVSMGRTISNCTSDGLAILSPSHTFPCSSETWSNWHPRVSDIHKYYFTDAILVSNADWPSLGINQPWFFAINKKRVAIHYRENPDKSFELEILDPTWIAGHLPSCSCI